MPLAQMPIFISFFLGIRRMAEEGLGSMSPEAIGFTTGGLGHMMDLTVPDPMFIAPVATSLTMLAVIEIGAEGNAPMQGNMKMVFRGMSVLIIPFMASMPAGLGCYWLTNNCFSLCQVALLKVPPVRDALGILPASALPAGQGLFGQANEVKPPPLQFADNMETTTGRRSRKKKAMADVGEEVKRSAQE